MRIEYQILNKPERSLLLPFQIKNRVNSEGTIPGANAWPNLHLPILDSPQYITISDAGQYSTGMMCYFHYQCNHFIDYFDDLFPDGAVVYAGNISFWYDEQEGTYTEFFGNQTGNILAANQDHEFPLHHRGTVSHVSHTPIESRKSNHNHINNSLPTQLPSCQCHLWIQVNHDTQSMSQGKQMFKQNI